ncbi:MAG: molybdopterin-dependent oxidoreductase [Deltaproteobacteria bacterium]|nr:molybdopterin-dependent oxidoreductase [Deltaproteobacteria bacterium]
MKTITLTINGEHVSCTEGSSLLEAAQGHGIKIPTLCHHHSLKPFGACRMCLVEDEKTGRIIASCVTPAAQKMSVLTDSPRVLKHRRNIVRLMMAEHPESCITCSKGNRCSLRQYAAELGIGETGLYPIPNYRNIEQANPFIQRDLTKCILCGKCIRADHELVVTGAIDYNMRGFDSRPSTLFDRPLEKSTCTFCGTCLSICPTGALSPVSIFVGTPEKEKLSFCGFCGVGCRLSLGISDNQVVEVNPAHIKKSVNDATLCVRGHFGHDFLNVKQRMTKPMIKKDGSLSSVSWAEAIELVAGRLTQIKDKHGPDSIAFLGSSKCANEENYLFQKLARIGFKTNNIDNGGYISGRLMLNLIDIRTDPGRRFNFFAGTLSGLEMAEVIFIAGADPSHSIPVAGYYLKRSAKNGTPVIVADPRKTEMAGLASVWLRLKPGSDLELINAFSALIYRKNVYADSFIKRFTRGFEKYSESLSSYDLERAARITGISIQEMERAVDLLAGKKIAFMVGDGIIKNRYGMETGEAFLNLALMTGSIGYGGAGFHFPAKENNQVGAWDMGTVPDKLPGRQPLNDSLSRASWEKLWGGEIPHEVGLDLCGMIEAAEQAKLKALYIMGENPLRSLPDRQRVFNALKKIDFIVVQDILNNETSKLADVVLPGAAFCEKKGTFTNMEGRLRSLSAVVEPPGDAKSDFEIIGLVAEKCGHTSLKCSVESIREELSKRIPMYEKGRSNFHPVWIKEAIDSDPAEEDDRERLISFSQVVTADEEEADKEYLFTAIIGSKRCHLGSGTRTGYSPRIKAFNFSDAIEISEQDSKDFGISDGNKVRLVSRNGAIEREVCVKKNIGRGMVFVPAAFNGNDAGILIRFTKLFDSTSEGWNCCPVKLEKI